MRTSGKRTRLEFLSHDKTNVVFGAGAKDLAQALGAFFTVRVEARAAIGWFFTVAEEIDSWLASRRSSDEGAQDNEGEGGYGDELHLCRCSKKTEARGGLR